MSQTVQAQCQYCSQTYPIQILQEHINQCQNRLLIVSLDQEHVNEISCQRCGLFVSVDSYFTHTQNQCVENQLERCNYCYINFPSYLIRDHLQVCEAKERQQRIEQQRRERIRRDQQRFQMQQRIQRLRRDIPFPMTIKRIRGNDSNRFEQLIIKQQASVIGQTCTICQQDIEIKQIIANIECQHVFHYDCLKEWGKQQFSCPSCRRQLKSTKKEIKVGEKNKIIFIRSPRQLQKRQFRESGIFNLLQSRKCLFKKLEKSQSNYPLIQKLQRVEQPEIKKEVLREREELNPEVIKNQIQQKRENIPLIQREIEGQKKEYPPVSVSYENQELQRLLNQQQ